MKTSNYKKWLYSGIAILVICGGSGFFVWKYLFRYLEPFETAKISTLQVLPYCEVKQNPTKYDGKLVKIDTRLNQFTHGYFLQDNACAEATDAKYLDSERTAILYKKSQYDALYEQLREIQRSKKDRFAPIRIIAVGRFTFRSPGGYSDSIEDRTPFHFELFSIEQATEANED